MVIRVSITHYETMANQCDKGITARKIVGMRTAEESFLAFRIFRNSNVGYLHVSRAALSSIFLSPWVRDRRGGVATSR
jgi:hypothetical protein